MVLKPVLMVCPPLTFNAEAIVIQYTKKHYKETHITECTYILSSKQILGPTTLAAPLAILKEK